MPILRNVRPVRRNGVELMAADFTISDGRSGCVEVSADEWQAHGDVMLQRAAEAVDAGAMRDRYQPPAHDRFRELR